MLDAAAMGEILETFIVSSTPIECITGIPAFDENDPDVLTSKLLYCIYLKRIQLQKKTRKHVVQTALLHIFVNNGAQPKYWCRLIAYTYNSCTQIFDLCRSIICQEEEIQCSDREHSIC